MATCGQSWTGPSSLLTQGDLEGRRSEPDPETVLGQSLGGRGKGPRPCGGGEVSLGKGRLRACDTHDGERGLGLLGRHDKIRLV